jgi:subtilisin family serine protease
MKAAALLFTLAMLGTPALHTETIREMQWHLNSWTMEDVWHKSEGNGISVAIVDGHVDVTHPDLAGQVSQAQSETAPDSHGTATASLIAATGRRQSFGVAPRSKILAFPSKLTSESNVVDPDTTIQSIRAAADSSARIINLSLAFGVDFPRMREAVSYAQQRGKLIVAGGGNVDANGPGPIYPAAYPGVVGVSAVGKDGRIWTGSNRGPWISLAAPGVDVVSACTSPTRYCSGTGSSGAAALTSGVAALVWSVHPDWTANQVIRRLIDTANRGARQGNAPNNEAGFGVVSPRRALASTAPAGPPDVNPLLGLRGVPASSAPSASSAGVPAPDVPVPVPAPAPAPASAPVASPGVSDRRPWWFPALALGLVPLLLIAGVVLGRRRRG